MANEKRLIALDEAIAKVKDDGILGEGYSDDERIDDVCDILESCEIVDAVEVKHGRWLFDSNTERCFCSACNEEALYTSKDEPIFDYDWEENLRYSHTETYLEEHLTNYCPNCGAKMDL